MRRLFLPLGLLLLAGTVVAVGPAEIGSALAHARWEWLLGSLAAILACQSVRAAKWAVLAGTQRRRVAGCYFLNAFLSNLTPAKAGEALAPWLFSRHCGFPVRRGVAVVTIDRVLELATLATVVLTAAFIFQHRLGASPAGDGALIIAGFIFAVLIGGLLSARLLSGWASRRFAALRDAFATSARPGRLTLAAVLAVAGWLFDALAYFFTIRAFVPIDFLDSFACQAVAAAAGLLSLVPGGIGVTTLGFVASASLLGYPAELVTSGCLCHLVLNHGVRGVAAATASRVLRPPVAHRSGTCSTVAQTTTHEQPTVPCHLPTSQS